MTISKRRISQFIIYVLLVTGLIIVILPMIYMVSTSLKPNGALYEYPPRFFAKLKEMTPENYIYPELFTE